MTRPRAILLAAVALLPIAVGLAAADRILARPGRVAAAARADEMLSVRDELLRFELDRGELPDSLDDLVPRYLRRDQIESDGRSLYSHDPKGRILAQAEGARIRGILTRRLEPLVMELPAPQRPPAPPEPPDPFAAGILVAPRGPELPGPPAGSFVFEAEHYAETNYGWEAHPDPECSGGTYLRCKEGIANGPGQTRVGVGDFYNVNDVREVTFLRYRLRLPAEGSYHVHGRMWTTDTHCSNWLHVAADKGGPYIGGMGNKTPFRWVWSPMKDGPVALSAGDHFLHVFIHEDGIRVDQFILSPEEIEGGAPFRANMLPGRGTAWEKEDGPAVHLSFDLKSMVVSPEAPPECRLTFRRLRAAEGRATAKVVLRSAAEGGGDLLLAEQEVDLASLPEICFMPIDFGELDLKDLPRREYLLVAELAREGETLASTHVPLVRPFAWEVSGVLEHLPNQIGGPLDGDRSPAEGGERRWVSFADASFEHFGVLDFGLHAIGNSLHAPQQKTIYARTRVHVPEAGTYLFKIQSDDQMIFWLDGKELCRHDQHRPVTRTAIRLPVELSAGEHRIRIRVNQGKGRWQACLRIRTPDDRLSAVTGLSPE